MKISLELAGLNSPFIFALYQQKGHADFFRLQCTMTKLDQ